MAERGRTLRQTDRKFEKKTTKRRGSAHWGEAVKQTRKSGSEIEKEKDLDDMRQTAVG